MRFCCSRHDHNEEPLLQYQGLYDEYDEELHDVLNQSKPIGIHASQNPTSSTDVEKAPAPRTETVSLDSVADYCGLFADTGKSTSAEESKVRGPVQQKLLNLNLNLNPI